ncbi:armadillo-type protein [Gautieria morchelliformis]|nr:armadillo-type protein [Gautieria morchelliformis]
MLTPGIIPTIHRILRDAHERVRSHGLKILAASIAHNNLHSLIFHPDIIATIQELLADKDKDVQCEALNIIVTSVDHIPGFKNHYSFHGSQNTDDLHSLVFSPKTISTIQGLLADTDEVVQCKVLDILVASMDHNAQYTESWTSESSDTDFESLTSFFGSLYIGNLHALIFNPDMIHTIQELLADKDEDVQSSIAHNNLHSLIFNPDIIVTFQELLADKDKNVQCKALDTLVASMDYSDLHGLIFTPGMISAIHNKLRDQDWEVWFQALKTLVASLDHNDLRNQIFNSDMTWGCLMSGIENLGSCNPSQLTGSKMTFAMQNDPYNNVRLQAVTTFNLVSGYLGLSFHSSLFHI